VHFLVPFFFSTCAIFDIRKREHAIGFLGFAMEAISIFVFSFFSLFQCHQSFFEGEGPMLEGGT
jgi:hypothetical protein